MFRSSIVVVKEFKGSDKEFRGLKVQIAKVNSNNIIINSSEENSIPPPASSSSSAKKQSNSRSWSASSEKEDEGNETIASMQEKLKRELTVKRKDEDELPALPVKGEPAIATQGAKAGPKDKKKSESSCCTIV